MDGVLRSFFILFLFSDALYFGWRVTAEGGSSEGVAVEAVLTNNSSNGLSVGESGLSNFTNNIDKANISHNFTEPNFQDSNISVISEGNLSAGILSNLVNVSAPSNVSDISGINVTDAVVPVVGVDNVNKSIEIKNETGVSYKSFVVTESVFKFNNSKSGDSYVNLNDSVSITNNANVSLIVDVEVNENNDESKPRGDMDPFDAVEQENSGPLTAENTHQNYSSFTDTVSVERGHLYSTMSWLDVFMLEHRGTLWIVFNTIFMLIWILLGGLSLYRLLGLPYCSPYISRTKYLVIHLLIFTASTFEFVQLIHFSYGSHEGLPLFLTLLLTHTPTPCLAGALLLTVYCVFVAARVPMVFNYLPPIIYVSILISFMIVLSFVGDIIVGVTRNGIFLIVCRVALLVLCLIVLLSFIFNYRRIVAVASLMRREFRAEMKALALPGESVEENQDAKLYMKKTLITWTRITLLGCIAGILMCLFSFCLSLFFTVSFVPLWAFWVLHTAIFVTQVLVVFSITFGAAYTLSYNSRESIFRKYFLPSLVSASSTNRAFIKRGNFIYQRVSVVNGPTITPSPAPTTIMEADDQNFLPNNNLATEMAAAPFRSKVNLKRSATFNCTPYYGFHRPPCAPFTPNLYPVLSDHILPNSQSQLYPSYNRHDAKNIAYKGDYHKPSLQHSNSFSHNIPNRGNNIVSYGNKYPLKSFNAKDRFVDLDIISKGGTTTEDSNRSCTDNAVCITTNPLGLAGTVESLEVAYAPINIMSIRNSPDQNLIRQIPHNHSFNAADRYRFKYGGPPEKPARRAEPILVKGVMKDNSYVKSTVPVSELYSPDKTNHCFPTKDFNGSHISRGNSPMHNITLGAGLTSRLESTNTSTPIPISKTSFATQSPSVSPISTHFKNPYESNHLPNTSYIYPLTNSPKENIRNRGNISFTNETTPLTNNVCTTVLKYPEESLPEIHPLIDKPEINDGNVSLSTDDTHNNSLESSPVPKRHSLRRNHSTAGDFPTREKVIDTEEENISGDYPQAVNGFRHPWYGTWGGRRRSKRKGSANGQDTISSSTLRRLSASKSSLSSIYEKIKPKRNKGSRKHSQSDECQELSSEANENSSISHGEEEVEEEEEEFLPRLDEDIDLASDILRSSTVLADFYSLDRSFLKKRKKAQLAEQEENLAIEMNGINVDVSNNHDNQINDDET